VLARQKVAPGKTPQEILENDLAYELQVAANLNDAIGLCISQGDNGTREILAELLVETESDHIFWLESQLHLIRELGLQRYLAEQLRS